MLKEIIKELEGKSDKFAMKLLLIVPLLFLSLMAHAQETCPAPGNGQPALNDCLKGMISVVNSSGEQDNPQNAQAAAELFLEKYKESVDFEVKPAESLVGRLKAFAESSQLSAQKKGQLWLLASGVHGRMADKLRANGGLAHGRFSMECLKKSIAVDRKSKNASKAFGQTIASMSEKNFFVRKSIEVSLKIDLADERAAAIKLLEENGLIDEPCYQKLKAF